MNRPSPSTTLLLSAAGLAVLGTLAIAQPAVAITNPADNPQKIVVKGDDGQTYVDGQDTLPGYDDDACTYIPGAWFDFDNNRVHFADGQSIPWTEWDRTAGYQEWLKKKSGSGSSGSGSGSGSTSGSDTKQPTTSTSSKTGSGSGSGSGSGTATGSSTKSSSTSSSAGTGTETGSGATSGSATDSASSGSSTRAQRDTKTATADETGAGASDGGVTASGDSAAGAGTVEAAAAQAAADGSGVPTPLIGAGILGGLAAAGGLTWGALTIRRRALGK